MKLFEFVKMKGLSQRGKNRITEHGDTMKVLKLSDSADAILVRAGDDWLGWFTFEEIEIIEEK